MKKELEESIIKSAKGKVIHDIYHVDDEELSYWVIEFENGSEMNFRFMSDVQN